MLTRAPNVTAALALALAIGGCSKDVAQPEEIRPVRVQRVATLDPARDTVYPGEVRARYETALGFRVPGKLLTRHVDVGQQVRKGQVLARLDPRDLQLSESAVKSQLAAAQADLDLASSELRRAQELREKNFISPAELERRVNAADAAKARLAQLRAQFDQSANQHAYAELTADADGVITVISAEAGQVVAAGQEVMRLARQAEKEVVISVPEHQVDAIQRGAPARVSLWAHPETTYAGRVREIAPATDPVTRTFTVKISVPSAPPAMRMGMTASVTGLGSKGEARMLLPIAALYDKQKTPAIWVVDPQAMTVDLVPVRVGGFSGNDVVVESGLAPGALAVIAGVHLLRPGQKVRLLDQPK